MFNFFNNGSTINDNTKRVDANQMNDTFDTLQKARMDIIDEFSAIIEYDNHIHSTSNTIARTTWEDIKNEELVHVGELMALIYYLDPSQQQYIEQGIIEFKQRNNTRQ